MLAPMREVQQQQARLEEAFERIEETILPCIAMMLDTLLDGRAPASLEDGGGQGGAQGSGQGSGPRRVNLMLSVFDPQGRVVADALTSLGYDDVKDVRQGKFFEVELDGGDAMSAKARVTEMADKLLANPVIESYRVEIL